jgi:AbrB family transcriptional regulator, transcriptional pleiotropic regulator of transition state genes
LTVIGIAGIIKPIREKCRKMTNLIDGKMRGDQIMKSTGIVRKVDELGRVVIPIELRRTLGIAEKDALEIYVDDDRIILKKYKPNMTCHVTGEVSDNNITLAGGKLILSREGAEQLLKEIQGSFEPVKA